MTPTQKDELIRGILALENSIISPRDNREIGYTFYHVISKLLSNDGFTTIIDPNPDVSRFNFMCTKLHSRERICIYLRNVVGKVDANHVHERVSFAYDCLTIFAPRGFTSECYHFVDIADPVKVELLTLDNLKTGLQK